MLFDTREKMGTTIDLWASKTFGEALAEFEVADENRESYELMKLVVKRQRLFDKPMDGKCSEGLKKDEFERMGVTYVSFVNNLEAQNRFWTPLDIIHDVCKNNLERRDFYEKKAKKYCMTFERVTWLMCGRALRALPSYVREYQLKNSLQKAFPDGVFIQDAELDMKYHCDIKMELNGSEYYFWSFISSPRSIYQFVDKFRSNRYGQVVDGTHVLCPFDRLVEKDAAYKGWSFYSKEYINEVKQAIFKNEHLDYYEVHSGSVFNSGSFRRPVSVDKITINA